MKLESDIEQKENDYEDGEAIDYRQLMAAALNKYKVRVEKKLWNAPSPEETKIIALQAKVKELKNNKNKLVISHEAGDEGFEYAEWLKEYACEHGVDLRLVSICITDPWNGNGKNGSQYSLWDVYPYADFITFPSLYEGFGNAFIEAVYFKKPILINRYATFVRDIEPLGFDLAVMDGFLSKKTVENVVDILESSQRRKKMVGSNYEIASRHYSYSILRNQLSAIMKSFFGDEIAPLAARPKSTKSRGYLYMNSHQVRYKHFKSKRYTTA